MASDHRINIPFRASCRLVLGYAARRLREQICSVAFIVAYLFIFQLNRETLRKIAEEPEERRRNLGPTGLDQWLEQKASDQERRLIEQYRVHSVAAEASIVPMSQILAKESIGAVRVIMPLTLFLLLVMWLFLRQRPRYGDEVIAGIIIAIAGMTLLTAGIRTGLHPLGDAVGNGLPQTFQADEEDNDTVIIQNLVLWRGWQGLYIRSLLPGYSFLPTCFCFL